jgi:antitoxin component of MazEF toxin-antitoxin module
LPYSLGTAAASEVVVSSGEWHGAASNAVPATQSGKGFFNFAVYALATLFLEEACMAKLTKWGNSIGGLRLPKAIIESAGLRVGDELTCRLLDNGTILLTPFRAMREAQQERAIAAPARPLMKW